MEFESTFIHEDEYITPTDVGCTGGLYPGILDHHHHNVMKSETGTTTLNDDADTPIDVWWIDSDNNTATIPPDDYEIIGDFRIYTGYHLDVDSYTSFLVGDEFKVYSGASITIDGRQGDDPYVYFGPQSEEDTWYRIYVWNPNDDCTFDGCMIEGADYGIYYQGNGVNNVNIDNCLITNIGYRGIYYSTPGDSSQIQNTIIDGCGYYGVYLSNTSATRSTVTLEGLTISNAESRGVSIYQNIEAICNGIEIFSCPKNGFYINGSYDLDFPSTLTNVIVHHCSENASSTTQAGVYCYNSNPEIYRCFVHDNSDYGIYITNTSDPNIDGLEEGASNIYNNGTPEHQTGTLGAEIRIADNNSMGLEHEISANNIADVSPAHQADGDREGKLVAKAGGPEVVLNHCYLGNECLEEGHPDTDPVAGDDFYWTGDNVVSWNNDVRDEPVDQDEWDNVDSNEEQPRNSFEEGLFALEEHNYDTAVEYFLEWIAEKPASQQATSAVHLMFQAEKANSANMNSVRSSMLNIADSSEAYSDLCWMARRMAVHCLISTEQHQAALDEYFNMRELAPSLVDSLFLEMDIIFAQDVINAPQADALKSMEARLESLGDMIEEALAADAEKKPLASLPDEFELAIPYPNPFNAQTRLSFTLQTASDVKLGVFDVNGRLVDELLNNRLEAGRYNATWNGIDQANGLYILRLEAGNRIKTQKITLVK